MINTLITNMFLFKYMFFKMIYTIIIYIKSNAEIQRRFWILPKMHHEQFPGRSKKYNFGVLPSVSRSWRFFCFLEGPILLTINFWNSWGWHPGEFLKARFSIAVESTPGGKPKAALPGSWRSRLSSFSCLSHSTFWAWSFWCSCGKTNQINTSPLSSMKKNKTTSIIE